MKRLHFATLTLLTLSLYFVVSQRVMPTGWASQSWQGVDLGAPGAAGNESFDGSKLTVTGAGAGVGAGPGGSEQGHFSHQVYSGDIEMVARIASVSGGPTAQVGLMLRESANGVAFMSCAVYQSPVAPTVSVPNPLPYIFQRSRRAGLPDNAVAYNTNAGGNVPASLPVWLKLVRVGQNYATYRSTDGRQWTPIWEYGGGAFTTSGNFLAGFFVSGGGSSASAMAVIDSIYIGPPRLEYRTSWVGNNYSNDADRYVSANINSLYVGADGRSYTNSGYDEAGEAAKVYGSDGRVLRAISVVGGNTCKGGHCTYRGSVTGDNQYIYVLGRSLFDSSTGKSYDQIFRTDLSGSYERDISMTAPTPLNLTTKTIIGGMAAANGELYLSDTINNRILVVSTSTQTELTGRSFAFTRPGSMAVDRRGNLWIIQRATDHFSDVIQYPAAIRCFRPDGTFTGQEITGVVRPEAVAIDPTQDRLIAAEAGPAQNIRFYALGGAAPVFTGTFGVAGGVLTGPNPGLINDPANGGWQRLYNPTGVGMDAQGNLYVSCEGVGSHLRKFDPQGNLLWNISGLSFVEAPDFDPATDGQDLYKYLGHFKLDYTQTAPGSEWRFAGLSRNLLAPAGQELSKGGNTVIRRFGPGNNRFMFTTTGVLAGEVPFRIYRYNGEIAVPCVSLGNVKFGQTFRLWVDRNGDGIETADERTEVPDRMGLYSPAYDVDAQGNIYILAMSPIFAVESAGTSYIRVIRCLGVNEQGVPLYSLEGNGYEDLRNPFDLAYVYSLRYDSANDAMFFIGFTHDLVHKLVRYDNWSGPNRSLRYLRTLPRPIGETPATAEDNANFLHFPPYTETEDFQQPGDINCTNPPCKGGFFYFAMDVAGDKVFLGDLWGPIHVYDAQLGNPITRLLPGPEVSGAAGWTDTRMGVRAFQRSTGEYVVVRGDAGLRSRNLLFRWTPSITPASAPDAPVKLTADSGADRIHLSWEGGWGRTTKYAVWRGTTSGGETLYAENLTSPAFTDTSVQFGTKYYYRVTAANEAGTSGFSNEVSAAANTAVKFSRFDVLTEGNWKGVYGREGYDIVGDTRSFPSHIKYTVTGFEPSLKIQPNNSPYLPPDSFVRSGIPTSSEYLVRGTTNDRIDAYWRTNQIQIDLNLTDGLEHQIALYFFYINILNLKAQSTVEVFDINGNLLDQRTLVSVNDGRYALWKISGHVKIVITLGSPAVDIKGVFVDPASSIPTACSLGAPPTIVTVPPQRVNACTGQSVTYTVQAQGQNLTYQWRYGMQPIAGATGPSFTIPSISSANAGNYDVVVTGACGSDISLNVLLPFPVRIPLASTIQPTDKTVAEGTSAVFSAGYAKNFAEPITTQWQVSTDGGLTFTNIPGGTPVVERDNDFISTLTLPPVTNAQNGYRYRAVFTNPCGVRQSNPATLTVIPSPDQIAPTTVATLNAPPNSAGWHNNNVTVTLIATDNAGGSGVQQISHSLNGGTPVTVSGASATLSIGAEGVTTITYFAKDNIGNTETTQTITVKLDKTKPTITAPANASYQCASQTPPANPANATVADNLSTPAVTVAESNNGGAGSTTNPLIITRTFTATDAAGNSATATQTINVSDTTPPVPDLAALLDVTGQCAATIGAAPTATDNCGRKITGTTTDPLTYTSQGTFTVNWLFDDGNGNKTTQPQRVILRDTTPPVITCPTGISMVGNIAGSCSANVNLTAATATDNCSGLTVTGVRSDGLALNAPYPLGTTTITWTATDAGNNQVTCQQQVTITNPAPVVTIIGPATGSVYTIGTPVSFTGTFTDNAGGTHTATWSFDDLSQPGTIVQTTGIISATYTFTAAGVYQVKLTVRDGCATSLADTIEGLTALVVIYDPNGGFVTGGGWINSPAGAYRLDPSLTGKANFGFVSKYQPGAQVPTGQTEFQFKAASLNFRSTSYDWLVVAGARAQYKGTGTINGSGSYGFLLTVIDGQINGGGGADKFRIKIWDTSKGDGNNGAGVVYDNQLNAPDSADPTTLLGGGSIVIHRQ